jgi:hypothetical protein
VNTDPGVVRALFASHYFLFAFLASLGTLQIAFANAGTRGLWMTPHAGMTRLLGIALILTAIAVFFLQPMWTDGPWAAGSVEADSLTRDWGTASWDEVAGARNVNDIHGGLDGVKQAAWFSLATLLAFGVSAIAGTVTMKVIDFAEQQAGESSSPDESDGLEGLVHRSYFSNLPRSFRNYRSDIGGLWRNGIRDADSWNLMKMFFGGSSK